MTDRVVLEGVLSKGYGSVGKLVMKDKDLSIEAKAIYAYLSSYAGGGDSAFPSVDLIINDLKISQNRFFKHRKALVDKGYISIKRNQMDKGWSNNIYTIHSVVHLQFEGIQNEDIQFEDIQNEGTNNNSLNNNSLNNNKLNKKDSAPQKNKSVKNSFGEFENVLLTQEEHQKLKGRFPNDLMQRIEKLSVYIASTGKKYKSHYATILNWARNSEEKQRGGKRDTTEYDNLF